MQNVKIKIDGMTCDGCVKSVEKALSDVNGIQDIKVNLDQGMADITFDQTMSSPQILVDEIEDAGFDASLMS